MSLGRAASNLARDAGAISPRSRNCRISGRIRWCTTSSATRSRGSAKRNRTWTSMSVRKGTRTESPHACPWSAERIRSGSQTNSGMRMVRARTCSPRRRRTGEPREGAGTAGPRGPGRSRTDPAAASHLQSRQPADREPGSWSIGQQRARRSGGVREEDAPHLLDRLWHDHVAHARIHGLASLSLRSERATVMPFASAHGTGRGKRPISYRTHSVRARDCACRAAVAPRRLRRDAAINGELRRLDPSSVASPRCRSAGAEAGRRESP